MALQFLAATLLLPSALAVRSGLTLQGADGCKKASFGVGLPNGEKVTHKLDKTENGQTVPRDCGGGFDGKVVFGCDGGKWSIKEANCYRSGVCAANDQLQLDLGDGQGTLITFNLPELAVGAEPLEIQCSEGKSSTEQVFGGTATFTCQEGEGEGEEPSWAVVNQACSFCAAADYKVTMPDGNEVTYNLDALTESRDVIKPCEGGFSGVVTFACQDFQWVLVREATDCVKRDMCPMTELTFHLDDDHDLLLDIDENRKPGEHLVVPCGEVAGGGDVTVEGSVTLTCDDLKSEVLWSIESHNCKIVKDVKE